MNDLRRAFVLANAFKEGDLLVGGTTDEAVRVEARRQLLHTTVRDIRRETFLDDGVTEAVERTRDRTRDQDLDTLTVGGLKQMLLRSERFVPTVTEKLLTYALGRGLEHYDAQAVRTIVRNAARDDYRFASLITGIAQSAPFTMRRAGE